jgi:hypothetical protein
VALDTDLAAARQAVIDNASYAADNSLAKARLFETACTKLVAALPLTRTAHGGRGGNEAEMDPSQTALMLDKVQRWIASYNAAQPGGGGVTHYDGSYFRD